VKDSETVVLMSEVEAIKSVVTPQLVVSITEAVDENLEVQAKPDVRVRRKQKKKHKPLTPRLNVSREKSPFGE
jgi:hypothetical protein